MIVLKILVMILISLVVIEFGIHVIYHAITGKAGVNEAPFDYLKEIWRSLNG